MAVLARAFWGVCILEVRPQDIPASGSLYLLSVALYTAANVFIQRLGLGTAEAVASSLAESFVVIVLTRALLRARGYRGRASQTLTALFGAGVMMAPPAWILRYWFVAMDDAQTHSGFANFLWILFFVWNLFVTAHVLRHALDVRLIVGFSTALAYVMILLLTAVALHQAAFHTST